MGWDRPGSRMGSESSDRWVSSEKGRDSETQRADSRVAMKAKIETRPRAQEQRGRWAAAGSCQGSRGRNLPPSPGGRPTPPTPRSQTSGRQTPAVSSQGQGRWPQQLWATDVGGGASEKAPGPGPGRAREAPSWGTARASGRPAQTPLTPTGVFDSLPSSVRSPADRPAQLPPTRRRRCRGAPRGVAGTQGVPVHPGAFASAFPVLDDVPMCSVTPSGPGPRCHLVRFLLDCLGEAGSLPSSAWPRLLSH